jgi:hypothetical protein
MKTNNFKLRVLSGVAVAVVCLSLSASASENHVKAAKKALKNVPAAELPAKAEAFIQSYKAEERVAAYQAVKAVHPNLPVAQPKAVQGATIGAGGPFAPGPVGPTINRNQTGTIGSATPRRYSRP